MLIHVGSGNPIKLQAIREVMSACSQFDNARFVSCPVSSGVPDQPIGFEQTLLGAKNRARAAFTSCSYSVALESGLIPVPQTNTGYMNLTACALYDGQNMFLGLGPAFELPDEVTRLVAEEGMELDPAVKKVGLTDNDRIGYAQGIIGILSQGRVTRLDYSKPAVSMALIRMGI